MLSSEHSVTTTHKKYVINNRTQESVIYWATIPIEKVMVDLQDQYRRPKLIAPTLLSPGHPVTTTHKQYVIM